VGCGQKRELIKHMSLEELNEKIKRGENTVRILERLYFMRFLYKGDTIKEACDSVNITIPTGYSWLESWNKNSYQGLIPHFSGGPKRKLSESEREELDKLLSEKEYWTSRDVLILIKERFGVEYSEMQI
jgi:putative transposase